MMSRQLLGDLRIYFLMLSQILFTPPVAVTSKMEPGSEEIVNGTAAQPPNKYLWTAALYFAGCFSNFSLVRG